MVHFTGKVACLLASNLSVQVERQRRGPGPPLIVPHPVDISTVFAASPEVLAAGIQPGTSVYQARQSAPFAEVVEPDETAYHARHGAIEAALRSFSPILETVGLGEFLVDARGLDRRGDDQAVAEGLHDAAGSASGLSISAGLATSKFVAQQAARQALPEGVCVVPPGGEAAFLAPLSVSVLPHLSGEMRRRLSLLDLHTLGDLTALKKAAVLRQFGAEASIAYELARGNDPRPLNPDVPPLKLLRSLQFTEPVSERRILLNVTERLSRRLAETLEAKGYHAEALRLTLVTTRSGEEIDGRAVKPPTSDPARLGRLAAQMLGRLQPAAPVLSVVLSAYPLRPWHLEARQLTLAAAGVPEQQTRLEEAIQLLWRRFGEAAVRVAALLGPPLPLPIRVSLNGQARPVRLAFGGWQRAVIAVDETWREEKRWWDRPVRRDYLRVVLSDGSLRNIFQDLVTDEWFLDRAWPLL
jgi:DNA polymerase-4